jgi:hypothetical protein
VSFHLPLQGNRKRVITGFNTDVEHDGVTYHVQTEDKGLKSPLILSLVYVGGTILASKRTPYEDLIAEGFDEKKLAERLNRQHKLICAAIHTGRIEDLKRQTEREASARANKSSEQEQKREAPVTAQETWPLAQEEQPPPPVAPQSPVFMPEAPVITQDASALTEESPTLMQEAPAIAPEEPAPVVSREATVIAPEDPDIIRSGSIADFMPPSVFTTPPATKKEAAVVSETPAAAPPPQTEQVDYSRVIDYTGDISQVEDLQISLLDEKRFVAGEFVKINVRVGRGPNAVENVPDAAVTLKVLGSSFRPMIFSGRTAPDGTTTFYAMLPYFTSGRAAILINATNREYKAELRRVIHQV